jgi:hypothetical protein
MERSPYGATSEELAPNPIEAPSLVAQGAQPQSAPLSVLGLGALGRE